MLFEGSVLSYTHNMSDKETISLWHKEARDSLKLAEYAHQEGMFALSLFHCHFAAEKELKALFMERRHCYPPPTHELLPLAEQLGDPLTEEDAFLFDSLTTFAVRARYHDAEWAEKQVTEENSHYWLERTRKFLSRSPSC